MLAFLVLWLPLVYFRMPRRKWQEELESPSATWVKKPKNDKESHLLVALLYDVFWNNLTWEKAQYYVKMSSLDGLNQEGLLDMASAGSWGTHGKNISRDWRLGRLELGNFKEEAFNKSPPEYQFEVTTTSK